MNKMMNLILMLLVFMCIAPAAALGQERIVKTMAGPSDGGFRVLISFVAITADSYKMQSLIIDVNRVKDKKDQPTSFYVDLTSTLRSLATGEKKQRILVLRWDKSGEIEVKCEGGKWAKQKAGPEIDAIVETVKMAVQHLPLDAKKASEITLPPEVEQKATSILNALETSNAECIRGGT